MTAESGGQISCPYRKHGECYVHGHTEDNFIILFRGLTRPEEVNVSYEACADFRFTFTEISKDCCAYYSGKIYFISSSTITVISLMKVILICITYTWLFLLFSVIVNIYNKKTEAPTVMELFTTTGKVKKFFLTTRDVRCVHHR